jgi:hypothetical protein
MATPVLPRPQLEPSQASAQFAAIYSGTLSDLPVSEERVTGLSCARGALMAIGIEMAAIVVALCLYGASRL